MFCCPTCCARRAALDSPNALLGGYGRPHDVCYGEHWQARMEVAAEQDHQANAARQPAVSKLKMLPEFEQVPLCSTLTPGTNSYK